LQPFRSRPASVLFVGAVVLLQVVLLLVLRISFVAVSPVSELLLLVSEIGVASAIAIAVERAGGRFRVPALVVIWLLIALLCYADTLYYREFQDFPTYAAVGRAKELTTVMDALPPLIRWYDAFIVLGVAGVAASLVAVARRQVWAPRSGRRSLHGLGVAMLLIATPWIINPKLSGPWTGRIWLVGKTGFLVYHAKDGLDGVIAARTPRPVAQAAELAEVRLALERYGSSDTSAAATRPYGFGRGLNILVVQIESFQQFAIGRVIGGRPVAPFLTALARQNLYFDNFFAQVGEGRTADADLLANCSLYPPARGVAYVDYEASTYACLPRRLAAAGYSTTAFQGMSPDFWNLSDIYKKVGFERFFSLPHFKGAERIGLGVSDRALLDRVAREVTTLKKPFYAFVATLTSHAPFNYAQLPQHPEFFREGRSSGAHYVNALNYTDAALRDFLGELEREGVLENTIVVLYGDHGGIGRSKTGFAFATGVSPEDRLQSFLTYNRVPLIIVLPPHMRQARTVSETGGEVDVAPTILYALGLTTPRWFLGKPLWNESPRVEAMHSGAIASGNRLWLPGGPGSRCFEAGAPTTEARCTQMRGTGAALLRAADILIARNALGKLCGAPGNLEANWDCKPPGGPAESRHAPVTAGAKSRQSDATGATADVPPDASGSLDVAPSRPAPRAPGIHPHGRSGR
jgi:lipoteichoic acid synthase